MPWQRQVADVGLELLPDGRPAYRDVTFTVPRQSGKTMLILAWELHQALAWSQVLGPQSISYSAQTGKDAREKLVDDQMPLLERHKALFGIRQFKRGMGSEGVYWANGSMLRLLASTEDSGHGKTIDLGIKDELFADADLRRDQSLIPATSTRPYAQLLTASTMGTEISIALNTKVEQGRGAIAAERNTSIAYFEWSAAPNDDPLDHETWRRCMPALGRTISVEAVEHAYLTMELGEFKRAYLNIATISDERVIPVTVWDLVNDDRVEAKAEVFAFDVNPERTAAAIVAASGDVLEVVNYNPGTDWVVARCADLSRRFDAPIAIDVNGPAGSLLVELRAENVPLIELKPQDTVRAAGGFYDAVVNQHVKIRRNLDLDNAVAGAAKRPVGDAWVWARKTSRVDITPLVAATIALAAAQDTGVSVYEQRDLIVL